MRYGRFYKFDQVLHQQFGETSNGIAVWRGDGAAMNSLKCRCQTSALAPRHSGVA